MSECNECGKDLEDNEGIVSNSGNEYCGECSEDISCCDDCDNYFEKGNLIVANKGGEYCIDCASDMPCCNDCDTPIEDGDYHLCEPCLASREARESF